MEIFLALKILCLVVIDTLRHPGISQYNSECLLRETNKALSGFLHVCKKQNNGKCIDHEDGVGIATGNWGCGAYGGDPELKSLLQWLAVSQVTELVLSNVWTVGDLWKKLVKYSNQRLRKESILGLFDWFISLKSA